MILASILAMFITMLGVIHYIMDTLSWGMFLAFLVIITIPFLIADVIADRFLKLSIVSFMIDIHEANQDQDKQREDQEPYFFDTRKLLSFPKKLFNK
jgi:hypothetical protein